MKMHKVENLIQEINDLVDLKFDNLQSWVALKKWAIGESRKLSGTISTKVIDTNEHIRFVTQIPPNEEFENHWHDCAEICTVLSGQLQDKVTGKIWGVNDKAVFSKGQKHVPMNPSPVVPCFLIVDFHR